MTNPNTPTDSALVNEASSDTKMSVAAAIFVERRTQLALAAAIIVFATLMVFFTLQPSLIFRNNTPTGGDMGAHVYGPAYLRDHLLTSFRLSGWSNDWYAGLPIYRFYMVVPAILSCCSTSCCHTASL